MIDAVHMKTLAQTPARPGLSREHEGLFRHTCTDKNVQDIHESNNGLLRKRMIPHSVPISIQPKLAVSRPDDPFELEADRVARHVMRMPEPAVQRMSSCPFSKGSGCNDEAERNDGIRVQRKVSAQSPQDPDVLFSVHDALQSPGEPLDAAARDFFEPRFGFDFGHVRIHTDSGASTCASAIAAEAFTYNRDIFFAPGFYAPHTSQTRLLLAHELTHTLQQQAPAVPHKGSMLSGHQEEQGKNRTGSPQMHGISPERAKSSGTQLLQRKVMVQKSRERPERAPRGETNAGIVNDYVSRLCSGFTVDSSGEVRPPSDRFCAGAATTSTPESCQCLCDMSAHSGRNGSVGTWNIFVADNQWPHTTFAMRSVFVHSPYSGMEFGAWSTGPNPHRMTEENWLVLGHELCGHAWLYIRGGHPKTNVVKDEGRVTHDPTVEIENRIAKEHGIPESEQRGLWASGSHHGESLASVTIAQFPSGSADFYSVPPEERRKITIARDFMRGTPSIMADVIGHADKPARVATANAIIAQQRAENVMNVLVGQGVRHNRFIAVTNKSDTECPQSGQQPQCRKAVIYMFNYRAASESHT